VDFEACFRIIEATSAEDYKKSKDGWRPKAKQKEMRLLDLKYLLVKRDGHVEGFTSFMPTYEDHYPVIYCYEIHLLPGLKGCVNALKPRPAKIRLTNLPRSGMGKLLMGLLDIVAANIKGVEKVMLTVFLRNDKAVQFYRKIGFKIDRYSPLPRVLRDGRIVEESYIILSKAVSR
jgi:N-alpha-acetyltransferase 40